MVLIGRWNAKSVLRGVLDKTISVYNNVLVKFESSFTSQIDKGVASAFGAIRKRYTIAYSNDDVELEVTVNWYEPE